LSALEGMGELRYKSYPATSRKPVPQQRYESPATFFYFAVQFVRDHSIS